MAQELVIPQELDTMAALQALTAQITQPVTPPREDVPQTQQVIHDKDYSGPQRQDGATVPNNDPLFTSPAPPAKESSGASVPSTIPVAGPLLSPAITSPVAANPMAAAPSTFAQVSNYQRLFFTGRTGVGKDWLAKQAKAQVLDAAAPLVAAARAVFPQVTKNEQLAGLLPTIFAWGEGTITKDYPLTPTRWLFVQTLGQQWPGFGSPGFWVRMLLESASAIEGRVAITNVSSPGAFKALKEAGFTHFHVMTSPAAYMQRAKRPGANDSMANALDQDAIKKVSAQRQGEKLPVVWNAPEAPPSNRIWTIAEFLTVMNEEAPATEETNFATFE